MKLQRLPLFALATVLSTAAFFAAPAQAQPTEPTSHTAATLIEAHESAIVDHGDHTHAHAERGLMDTHRPDLFFTEMVWSLVIFGVFFAVLSVVVWPKILGALQAREEKQRTDLKTAENAAKEAKTTLAAYQQQLAEARAESQRILEKARGDAEKLAASLKSQAETEIGSLKQRATAEIRSAHEQAIAEVYEQAATLSAQIAGQILRREIRPEDQQALVRQSLDALKSAKLN